MGAGAQKDNATIGSVVFFASIVLSSGLGMVFMPKEDKSQFDITIKAEPGISMDEMKKG